MGSLKGLNGLKGFEGFESGLNGLGSPVDNRILEYYGRTITVETIVPQLWNIRVQRVWNDRVHGVLMPRKLTEIL